jgi:SAM-dependent methyltransferase
VDVTTEPNAEQVRYWNELAGPRWVKMQRHIDAQIEPIGVRAIEQAAIAEGDRVLDVGCGCGTTTIAIARKVAPGGRVHGVDLSKPMLTQAKAAAQAAGLDNATFEHADAQVTAWPTDAFDVLFSRFGVMFFDDPVAAFTNLRGALREGGRLTFACWQGIELNPWLGVPFAAAKSHFPPLPAPDPHAPGPMAFADAERVRGILQDAGFMDVAIDDVRETLRIGTGPTLDDAVAMTLQAGPTARLLREANDPALEAKVAASIREAVAPFWTDAAGLRMASAAWLVSARR